MNSETGAPLFHLPRGTTKEELFRRLGQASSACVTGIDATLLACEVDQEVAESMLEFCSSLPDGGLSLRIAHNDLGSGRDTEQRFFDRLAEREKREAEKKYHEQQKRDSSKQKDFGISAGMRRKAEEGISVTAAHLAQLDEELGELARLKKETPWYALFARMEARSQNRVVLLDLSNCGLHCTGITMLTEVLLALEQRSDGEKIRELIFDGNALEDIGMTPIASLLRLTSHLQVLRLRNVGITERGVSQVLSGLVGNKTIQLVDLQANGLASATVCQAAVDGVRRFNNFVQILL